MLRLSHVLDLCVLVAHTHKLRPNNKLEAQLELKRQQQQQLTQVTSSALAAVALSDTNYV